MGRPPKRTIKTRSQSNSSNHGHPPAKKMCYPLGTFSVLPLEIKEEILSLLPISSVASMASVSREWMKFTEHWLQSPRATRIILTDIERLGPTKRILKGDEIKTFISLCSSVGDLIRLATQFSNSALRFFWVRRIMAELCLRWNSDDYILRGFGAYFNCCFRSSDSEELDKIMPIVFWKLRMKTYITTQLKHGPGTKKNHEVRTRLILRTVFSDSRLLVAAMKNLTEGRENEAVAQARISFVLYGPTCRRTLNIDWDSVSRTHVSASSMMPLSHFLNMSFWQKEPFDIKLVLEGLLSGSESDVYWTDKLSPDWSTSAVAALFVTLDSDLCIPYLQEKSKDRAQILVKIGLVSLKKMMDLSDQLRNVLNAASFKTLCSEILSAIPEKIVSQKNFCEKTCGDCSNCPTCPMGGLKKIQTTIEVLSSSITKPPRKSERLSRKL